MLPWLWVGFSEEKWWSRQLKRTMKESELFKKAYEGKVHMGVVINNSVTTSLDPSYLVHDSIQFYRVSCMNK